MNPMMRFYLAYMGSSFLREMAFFILTLSVLDYPLPWKKMIVSSIQLAFRDHGVDALSDLAAHRPVSDDSFVSDLLYQTQAEGGAAGDAPFAAADVYRKSGRAAERGTDVPPRLQECELRDDAEGKGGGYGRQCDAYLQPAGGMPGDPGGQYYPSGSGCPEDFSGRVFLQRKRPWAGACQPGEDFEEIPECGVHDQGSWAGICAGAEDFLNLRGK